ncbi:rRNA maturation RNase YbeY [Tengunoibacter tsumagoiensis]|uniref:Endoribonuclease YbeY n=1 Tax=Tengunoibacter tsumagoiensis TaxID=2014871 RepID=A0A401ZY72_9CHLR|nr:rRNA maturation RNase YbeY [Tengunoibacter tsumagoiensis]GCE11789.1 endoribonuclease YbeY [Tengunoibacter tsumagoiensis]
MQEHPLIELYITIEDEQQSALIEQQLSAVDLDAIVLRSLESAGITKEVMLTLMITDDAGIREMNKQYREQDKATDVLSFPLLESPLAEAPADQLWQPQENVEGEAEIEIDNPAFVNPPGMVTNLGDIVISWPRIVQQAGENGHDALTELLYLLSHGVLHLVGYDDQTEVGYETMVQKQNAVLQACGYKA